MQWDDIPLFKIKILNVVSSHFWIGSSKKAGLAEPAFLAGGDCNEITVHVCTGY